MSDEPKEGRDYVISTLNYDPATYAVDTKDIPLSPQIARVEWRCELFGCGQEMVLTPLSGDVPNVFWRWMQYLCFGNKWVRIKR